MSFQSYRRHVAVPALAGLRSCYMGNSISDKATVVSGVTMGKYRDTIDAFYGLTRVGDSANINDWTRAAQGGRTMSAQSTQVVAGESTVVQTCLAYLPNVVFLELGTNDWYYSGTFAGLTPANIVASWDNLFATLLANVAVKSIQAVIPSATITGGTYTLTQGGHTTAAISPSDTIAAINTKLAAASILYTASIGLLSGNQAVILTANAAGASTAFTLTPTGITGGTLSIQGGLGGTPSVQLVVVVGTADHSGTAPLAGLPSWAASNADCWRQIEGANQRWHKWVGYNGIPIVSADLRAIPATSLIDGTHPTDPAGTAYYVDRIVRALTMAD